VWNLDDPDRKPSASTLDIPGGFVWWYADAIDAKGDGLVCIWSWGLPFLPGDRAARLRGRPPRPRERPSFNLVIYRSHQPVSYHLHRPTQASWEDDRWVFDDTVVTRTRHHRNTTLHAQVRLPVPGRREPLEGHFTLRGPTAHLRAARPAPPDAGHLWAPLTGPSTMDVDLRVGSRTVLQRQDLPAYHDRNVSPVPLDGLGMRRWTWGRHILAGRTWVHYLSWPDRRGESATLVVAELDGDGQVRAQHLASVGRLQRRAGRVGMTWWRKLEIPTPEGLLEILHAPPVDDGPFYLRMPTRARLGGPHGPTAPGWAEWCQPDRIDMARHRWLVSMCVSHGDRRQDSAWLPLFAGTRDDAWARLARRWTDWTGRTA